MTSVCVDNNTTKYSHSQIMINFNEKKDQILFFELERTVEKMECFTISVTQQGNRIAKERLKVGTFKPCSVSVRLKKDGKVIAC